MSVTLRTEDLETAARLAGTASKFAADVKNETDKKTTTAASKAAPKGADEPSKSLFERVTSLSLAEVKEFYGRHSTVLKFSGALMAVYVALTLLLGPYFIFNMLAISGGTAAHLYFYETNGTYQNLVDNSFNIGKKILSYC